MAEETPYFFNFLPNLLKILKGTQKEKEMLISIEESLKQSFSLDLHEKAKRFLEVPSIGFIPANKEYFRLYYELIQLYTRRDVLFSHRSFWRVVRTNLL
jgi:hypothetical protein